MAGKYTKSKKADQDIQHITKQSIIDFGVLQTDKYMAELENCLQLLADNPDIGRACDDLRKGYKRHQHGSHVIFYKKRRNDIFIVRILYQRMKPDRYL